MQTDYWDEAKWVFGDCNVSVSTNGRRYLGAAIGNPCFVVSFLEEKITAWCKEVEVLSGIALSQPQAA